MCTPYGPPGLMYFMMRKGGNMLNSMGGGKGGPGDIFKIGKSNVKKVNKVTNCTSFLGGCTAAKTH